MATTRRREEERAAHHVERQGFEFYLPRFINERGHARILFEGYLFVRLDLRRRWASLCSTRGISRLLMHDVTPVRVPDGEIMALRSREDARGFVCLHPRPRAGERVRVRHLGVAGIVQGDSAGERIAVLFSLLGRSVEGEFLPQQLEPA